MIHSEKWILQNPKCARNFYPVELEIGRARCEATKTHGKLVRSHYRSQAKVQRAYI